ncbi:MAG: hypothetical protein GX267_00110 [Fibrobacter sp.]|nr:hypothetical protein [Fibrobacter sp.]
MFIPYRQNQPKSKIMRQLKGCAHTFFCKNFKSAT